MRTKTSPYGEDLVVISTSSDRSLQTITLSNDHLFFSVPYRRKGSDAFKSLCQILETAFTQDMKVLLTVLKLCVKSGPAVYARHYGISHGPSPSSESIISGTQSNSCNPRKHG